MHRNFSRYAVRKRRTGKMKNKRTLIISMSLWFMLFILQLIAGERNNTHSSVILLLTMSTWCELMSIVVYNHSAFWTIGLTVTGNIFVVISEMIQGQSFISALETIGLIEVGMWLSIPVLIIISKRRKKQAQGNDKEPLKIINIAWWLEIVIACTILTITLELTENSGSIVQVGIVVLGTVVTMSKYIRNTMFIKLLTTMEVLKLVNLITNAKVDRIYAEGIIYLAIEIGIVGYVIWEMTQSKKGVNGENGEEASKDGLMKKKAIHKKA